MSYISVNRVQLLHASLVWPLQIELRSLTGTREQHREIFDRYRTMHPWERVDDEFVTDPSRFNERHYREFVSFLPYVQRVLYGEGRSGRDDTGDGPVRVYRRKDIAKLRLTLGPGQLPITIRKSVGPAGVALPRIRLQGLVPVAVLRADRSLLPQVQAQCRERR